MSIKERNGKFDVRLTKVIAGQVVEKRVRGLSTKGEARRAEIILENELQQLKLKGWPKRIIWQNALEDYFEFSKKKFAFSTFESAKSILNLHTECWRNKEIDSFIAIDIEQRIEEAYPDSTTESRKKLLQLVRVVFRRQIDLGKVKTNPCANLSFKKGAEKELIAMTRQEILLLLDRAQATDHPWFPIWRVMYELGLRSGEGFALTWNDVDFNTARISINKSYCFKSKTIGPTKNRKTRTIPVNNQLLAFLKELKLQCGQRASVLPQLQDWKHGDAAAVLRTFQRDLGIRETNFHSLRASFITHLLLAKVQVTEVQKMVGHSDLKTTQRYVRLVASDLDGATEALAINDDRKIGTVVDLKTV